MKVQYIVEAMFVTGQTASWTVDHIHKNDFDCIELYQAETKIVLPLRNILWINRTLSCDCGTVLPEE